MAIQGNPIQDPKFREHMDDLRKKHTRPRADIVKDSFYDIMSDAGWNRQEVDEMELKPEDIDMSDWYEEDIHDFIKKEVENWTGYHVEYKYIEKTCKYRYEFHNQVKELVDSFNVSTEVQRNEPKTVEDLATMKNPYYEIKDTDTKANPKWIGETIADIMEGLTPIHDTVT